MSSLLTMSFNPLTSTNSSTQYTNIKYFSVTIGTEVYPMIYPRCTSFKDYISVINRLQNCSEGDLYYQETKLTDLYPALLNESNSLEFISALEKLKAIQQDIVFKRGTEGVSALALSTLPMGPSFNPPVGTPFNPRSGTISTTRPEEQKGQPKNLYSARPVTIAPPRTMPPIPSRTMPSSTTLSPAKTGLASPSPLSQTSIGTRLYDDPSDDTSSSLSRSSSWVNNISNTSTTK